MSEHTSKSRLDTLLVQRGLASGADEALRLIMAGRVEIKGHGGGVLTPGMTFDPHTEITLREPPKYVSRGGLKLEHALREFDIDVRGLTVLDIGASTGGFTDCLLQHGAKRVYAVDAGRGQLHSRLLADQRVISMERTNARRPFALPEQVDLIVADVSFISLLAVLPPALRHLKPGGAIVALFKPQFEAEKGEVARGGVITDDSLLERLISRFKQEAPAHGLEVTRVTESPVRGDRGNREFLAQLVPSGRVDRI